MQGWLGLLAAAAVAGCTATSTSSSAAPGHGRSANPAATTTTAAVWPGAASGSARTRPVTPQPYAVTISIPVGWQPTPDYTGQFAYDGTSGWVVLDATADPFGLHTRCTDATLNVLHPFGLHPLVIYRSIDGRPGCLIFPSSDAAARARRAGGPAFQDSEALVAYRRPGAGGSGCISPTGQPCLWSLLVIDTDPGHLVAIVDSVQLHH
jgi:hypothetical protein